MLGPRCFFGGPAAQLAAGGQHTRGSCLDLVHGRCCDAPLGLRVYFAATLLPKRCRSRDSSSSHLPRAVRASSTAAKRAPISWRTARLAKSSWQARSQRAARWRGRSRSHVAAHASRTDDPGSSRSAGGRSARPPAWSPPRPETRRRQAPRAGCPPAADRETRTSRARSRARGTPPRRRRAAASAATELRREPGGHLADRGTRPRAAPAAPRRPARFIRRASSGCRGEAAHVADPDRYVVGLDSVTFLV